MSGWSILALPKPEQLSALVGMRTRLEGTQTAASGQIHDPGIQQERRDNAPLTHPPLPSGAHNQAETCMGLTIDDDPRRMHAVRRSHGTYGEEWERP
jgi:hypothetical protein